MRRKRANETEAEFEARKTEDYRRKALQDYEKQIELLEQHKQRQSQQREGSAA